MLRVCLILFASLHLIGCTTLAVGSGAAVGVAAAREGGLKQASKDAWIKTQIRDMWFRNDVEIFRKLNLEVNQGRVLVTGTLQDPERRVEAIRLAWQPNGVEQVINEIRINKDEGIPGFARDSWITAQIRTKITVHRDIQSLNYSIDTVGRVVYIMGVAQDQQEINQVIEVARKTANVQQVISYAKLAGQEGNFDSDGRI